MEDGRGLFSSEHDYVMVVALPTTEEIRTVCNSVENWYCLTVSSKEVWRDRCEGKSPRE